MWIYCNILFEYKNHSTSSSITLHGYLTPYYYKVSNDNTPIIPILFSPLYNPNNLFAINPPYFYSLSLISLNYNYLQFNLIPILSARPYTTSNPSVTPP